MANDPCRDPELGKPHTLDGTPDLVALVQQLARWRDYYPPFSPLFGDPLPPVSVPVCSEQENPDDSDPYP